MSIRPASPFVRSGSDLRLWIDLSIARRLARFYRLAAQLSVFVGWKFLSESLARKLAAGLARYVFFFHFALS
jgi:1,4-dihydroxy-2-naphthoyl-CoA synthase